MQVLDAILQRKSVRAFLPQSVPMQALRQALEHAARAPSNGNMQPWRVIVASGERLALLKQKTAERIATSREWDEPEYEVYPRPLPQPYLGLRNQIGEDLYQLIGIAREDKAGRWGQFARNGQLFDAPVGIFCFIDRRLGYAQWLDTGMFLQNLMLLLEDQGLATCPQGYWSFYHKTVAECLQPDEEWMLVCGLAVGYEDREALINELKSPRQPLQEFVRFES